MGDYHDRRKERRKKVMAFTLVYNHNNHQLLGYLKDITLHGLLVVGTKRLDVDTQLSLLLKLPDDLPDIKETELIILAKVARCVDGESSNEFDIGFEFTEVKPKKSKIIKAILDRYHNKYDLSYD